MDKVVHFEIPVDEVGRAQKFYKNIFGWSINQVPGMEYYMVNTVEVDEKHMPKEAGAINGGMFKRNAQGQSPIIVINVSSVDEYIKKVQEAGGKVVLPKQKVGDFGIYAQFSDTEGNILGLWQNLK
ncbi:MAG: VOC family protein [Nitrososphaerales archaeon]